MACKRTEAVLRRSWLENIAARCERGASRSRHFASAAARSSAIAFACALVVYTRLVVDRKGARQHPAGGAECVGKVSGGRLVDDFQRTRHALPDLRAFKRARASRMEA